MQLLHSLTLQERELPKLCELLNLHHNKGIYLLRGDLASGKTTLVRFIVQSLNSQSIVTSPTFLLAQEYQNNIYHYDIFQKDLQSLLALGLLEEFEKEGWHFIEWGDEKLAKILKQIGISFRRKY